MFIRQNGIRGFVVALLPLIAGERLATAGDYVFAPVGNSTRRDLPENWVPYGGPTGPNDREVSVAEARGTGERTATAAQIPEGFELVWITDETERDEAWPRINNCGEIVFGPQNGVHREIFYYDNGQLTQVTNDPKLPSRNPAINLGGEIVWTSGYLDPPYNNGFIRLWDGVQAVDLGLGQGPAIDNHGNVVWNMLSGDGCTQVDSDIFYYSEGKVSQLTEDFLSNQSTRMNNLGHIVWTHFNFCIIPWVSFSAYFDGMDLQLLPRVQPRPHAPDINDSGLIAWGGDGGIEIWEDGKVFTLTDWGYGPRLNENGAISFLRWHDEISTWQVWLYCEGIFYQITDDPFDSTFTEINDHGEVVMESGDYPQRRIRLLRRVRNGDVDFDSTISLLDFASYEACSTGPVETERLCDCRFFDIDQDRDVDLRDFAYFANVIEDS